MKVTILSTTGAERKAIMTDAITWAELKSEIGTDFGDLSSMKALIKTSNPQDSKNKMSLDHNEAVLPTEDFTLFLHPTKQKAGGICHISDEDLLELRTLVIDEIVDIFDRYAENVLPANGTSTQEASPEEEVDNFLADSGLGI